MPTKEKQTALEWVAQNEKHVNNTHMTLWEYAEVGLQEMKTARHMIDLLKKHGFKINEGVADMPSAFVATWGSGKPVIGSMGELDALPGISQKAVPHREPLVEGAAGHGCGHNGYATAALYGSIAAKIAMEEHKIKGTIKCFGCPAEETLVGKVYMIRDGVFDGVDACLGHHPSSSNGVSLSSGNAMNSVKFEFYGKSSHAASDPHNGISAMDGIELMNIGVNYLREHVIQETRMHYVIEDGGHEPNVVPPYARSWYYVRAPTRALVNEYYEKVLKIADGADLMVGTTHKVRFLTGVHNGLPNRPLGECVVANMKEIGAPTYDKDEIELAKEVSKSITREAKLTNLSRSAMPNAMDLMDVYLDTNIYEPYGEERKGGGGSSDVADVAWNLPTQQYGTTCWVVASPGHSWQNVATNGTTIGQKSSVFASKVMATSMLDLLMKPDIVKKAKEDWMKRMEGQKYVSPLPSGLKPPLDQLKPMHD